MVVPVPTSKAPAKDVDKSIPSASASGPIQYTMERGNGKERLVTVKSPSTASPARLWETLTSYDRFTQFIPDVVVSQREGQTARR